MSGVLDGVRAAVKKGGSQHIKAAVAALPGGDQAVLRQLLESLFASITREKQAAERWQLAALTYLPTCTETQLREWRWRVADDGGGQEAEIELLPFMLHASRAAIRAVHYARLRGEEDEYEELYREDVGVTDEGYMEGLQEIALEAMWAFGDSMDIRDRLLKPLLQRAVRCGAACLPLAEARQLDKERGASWEGAGAWWGEQWEPETAAHAAFHPRFRAAVHTLLLASHHGLPGTDPRAPTIHLPCEVLHSIVRHMANSPGAEAAWVPLVGPLPGWVDLNSTL